MKNYQHNKYGKDIMFGRNYSNFQKRGKIKNIETNIFKILIIFIKTLFLLLNNNLNLKKKKFKNF